MSLNAQDVSQVRQDFNKFLEELKKKAEQPIDLNINESKFKELTSNVKSVNEAIERYKKFGDVSTSLKFDSEGNLEKFKLSLKEIDGMIHELQFKVNGFQESKSGKLIAMPEQGYSLQGINQLDKRAEKIKELTKVEETLLKAEQKLANQIADGREDIENKKIKESEDLASYQQRQAEKIAQQRLKKEQEYDDFWQKALFEKEQSEKSKDERIYQERSKREQQYNDFWEKALKEKELKELQQQENLANRIGNKNENSQNNRRQEESRFDIKQAQAQNKVLEENYDTILKLQTGAENLKNKYGELINQTDFSKIQNQMKNLSPKDTDSIEKATKDLKEYEQTLQEIKRIASLGTKVVELPKDKNIVENEQALKRYVQELYKGQKAYVDYSKSVDTAGKEYKTFKVEIDEGNNKIRQEKLVVDEATGAIYRNSQATKDLSKNVLSIGSRLKEAFRGFASFFAVTGGIYAVIRQVKEGIGVINDINKAQTDIRLITGKSRYEVQELTKDYSNMASELKTTTTEIMSGASEFLRAGHDVKETQALLKASTIGSAISGQSNQEMSQELIAISNGFKMVTSDAKQMNSVIDTLSTLDNNSATSMAEIAQAIQRTASSAQNAGTNFEQLSTYIATVSSISRKSAESIGESFKTMFARLQNVKLKKAIDDEGQVISDVEAVLKKFGLQLRDTKNHFKDFPVIISELKPKWQEFTKNNDQLSKSMIANALAGTRQRENFLLLMDNLSTVEDLTKKVANANGDAERKFDSAYKDSTKARIAEFKNEVQKLWQALLSSDVINSFISFGTKAIKMLKDFTNMSTVSKIAIFAWGTTIVATIKIIKTFIVESTKMGKAISLTETLIKALIPSLAGATNATVGFTAAMSGLKTAMLFLFTTPQGWAILGIASALAIATAAMQHHSKVQQKLKEDAQNLTTAYQSLGESIKNLETIKSNDDRLKQMEDKVGKAIDLKKQLVEVEKKLADAQKLKENHEDQPTNYKELIQQQRDLTQAISEQDEVMKKAGVSIDDYNSLKEKIDNVNIANAIKEQTRAEYEQKDAITSLWSEYNQLNAIENKNNDVKGRMTQIANELKEKIGSNTKAIDENGNVIIENTELVDKNVKMLNTEGMTIESLTAKRLNDMKQNRMVQANMTSDTYANVKARVAMMKKEMNIVTKDMDELAAKYKNGTITAEENAKYNAMQSFAMSRGSSIVNFDEALGEIDKIYSIPKSSGSYYNSDNEGSGYDAYYKEKEPKKEKQDTDPINVKINLISKEKAQLDLVNEALTKQKELESNVDNKGLIDIKEYSNKLLVQKSTLLDEIYNKEQRALNDSRNLLSQFEFKFDENGLVTNQAEKLDELQNYANSLHGDERKNFQDHVKNIEKELGVFSGYYNSVAKNRTEHQQVSNELQKNNFDILKAKIDIVTNTFEETSQKLKEQLSDLDVEEAKLIGEDIVKQLEIAKKKKDINQKEIAALTTELESLKKIVTTNKKEKDELDKQIKGVEQKLREAQIEDSKLEKTIKENHEKKVKMVEDVESKITEIYKKQIEVRKKKIEEQYDKELETYNKIKKLHNQENEETDRQKELGENQADLDKLKNEYQISLRSTDDAGKKRTEELKKAIEEQEKKINNLITKQERDRYNESLDSKISDLEQKKKSEVKSLEDTWTPQKIAESVKEAFATGTFKDIEGNIKNVKDVYSEFLDKFENGATSSGKKLKEDFIKNFDIAIESVKDLDNSSQNFTNIFDEGLKNIGTTVANIMIPNFEKLKGIIEKIDMSKFGIDGITSTKVTLPQSTNISSIVNNVSNVRNQPVSLKNDIKFSFGDVKTNMNKKEFVSMVYDCKDDVTRAVGEGLNGALYRR